MGERGSLSNLFIIGLFTANILPEVVLLIGQMYLPNGAVWRDTAYKLAAFYPAFSHANPPQFAAQPLTMFLTYGFIHTGPVHLGVNMVVLAWIARRILRYRSPVAFCSAYLVGLVGAGEIIALIGSPAPVVGASGALYGMVALYLFDLRFLSRGLRNPPPLAQNVALLVGLTALVIAVDQLSYALTGEPVSWQAHAGGFLTGGIMAMITPPELRPPKRGHITP